MDKVLKKLKVAPVTSMPKPVRMDKILKSENVQICDETFVYHQSMASKEEFAPEINLIKKGDVIESIEIICVCGKRIEILCQYE